MAHLSNIAISARSSNNLSVDDMDSKLSQLSGLASASEEPERVQVRARHEGAEGWRQIFADSAYGPMGILRPTYSLDRCWRRSRDNLLRPFRTSFAHLSSRLMLMLSRRRCVGLGAELCQHY